MLLYSSSGAPPFEKLTSTISIPAVSSGTSSADPISGGSFDGDGFVVLWDYGGSVEPSGSGYAITATPGYAIDEILVDGKLATSYNDYHGTGTYTWSGDSPTHVLSVSFAHTINFHNPASGGSLSVSRAGSELKSGSIVCDGETLTLVLTVPSGWAVADWGLTGVALDGEPAVTTNADGGSVYTVEATVIAKREETPVIQPILEQSLFEIEKDKIENASLNSKDSAKAGEKVTIQLNVNDGYEVTSLVLKDKDDNELDVKFTDNGNGSYSFFMPSQDVKISAKVEKIYKLTTSKTGDGTVTLTVNDVKDKAAAPAGATVTVTAKPDNGYILKSLTYTGAGGALVPIESGGTFTMPARDVTVTAEFEEQDIQIIEEGGTGTVKIISQDGKTGEVRLTATPHDGYRVKGVYYTEKSGLTRNAADGGQEWILAIPVGTTLATVNTWAFTPSKDAQNIQIKVEYMDSSVTKLEISTEEGLRELAASVNAGNNYEGVAITLTDDIKLHGEWMPIGKNLGLYEAPFQGAFDGNHKTISGLLISPATDYLDFDTMNNADCGLFGVLGSGAAVKNLTVSGEINTRVGKVASDIHVGGIAGRALCNANMPGNEQISITNCVSQVKIDAEEGSIAGITGYASKTNIIDCVNEGNISIKTQVAATATATAAGTVGGIAGSFLQGNIIRCLNKGNITHDAGEFGKTNTNTGVTQGQKAQSGCFAGIAVSNASNGNIIDCVNKGSITGDMTQAGGLITSYNQNQARQVLNSYSTGNITLTGGHNYPDALGRIGGLYGVGYAAETVKNCYSSGAVTVEYPSADPGKGVYADDLCGGSFEGAAPTMINCYGLTDITAMGSGALLAKLNKGSGTIEWEGETVNYWKSDEVTDADGNTHHLNGGYPMLYWEDTGFTGAASMVTFVLAPSSAELKVYDMGELVRPESGTAYSLYDGLTYTYTVEADGYVPVSSTFTVNGDETISVELKPASIVAFQITPAEAALTVEGSAVVAPDSSTKSGSTATYVYTLQTGTHYLYNVSAAGYVGVSQEFDANGPQTITVTMEESFTNAAGEKPAIEAKSETVIEDGTATTTVDSNALAEKLEGVEAGTLIVIKPEIPGDETTHTTVTVLTRSDVGNIAKAEASLKVSTPLADIFLPNDALRHVAGKEGQEDEKATITAAVTEDGICIEVAANHEVMGKVDGGLKATLPVSEEELTAGSVMVLVDEEGKEAVIKKSAPDKTGVTALLKGSCIIKVVENAKKFDDVTDGVWYFDPVAFTTSHELFVGVSETEFAPEMQMSRAMLVTVLHRLEDAPNAETLNSFADVSSSWYTDAVNWANGNGIVLGYSASVFAPDDNVTREQIAVILYRYMQYMDLDMSVRGKLDGFTDCGETSDWAVEALEWAVGTGLIQGKGDNILDPTGIASRAEVSAMLQRLITLMVV